MPRPPSKSSPSQRNPDSFGAFMPDGSYFPEGQISQRGVTDRFVRAMVKSRMGPGFHPETASAAIQLGNQTQAFPNHEQWGRSDSWVTVWTSTSAEEAVKRCGLGEGDRHWCGQRWEEGPEKSCLSEGHRPEKDPERIAELVGKVGL